MALGGKGPGLVIAVAGKPKPSEGDKPKAGSAACKALWQAIKDDDYDAFQESLDMVIDERMDGGDADKSEESDEYDNEE